MDKRFKPAIKIYNELVKEVPHDAVVVFGDPNWSPGNLRVFMKDLKGLIRSMEIDDFISDRSECMVLMSVDREIIAKSDSYYWAMTVSYLDKYSPVKLYVIIENNWIRVGTGPIDKGELKWTEAANDFSREASREVWNYTCKPLLKLIEDRVQRALKHGQTVVIQMDPGHVDQEDFCPFRLIRKEVVNG